MSSSVDKMYDDQADLDWLMKYTGVYRVDGKNIELYSKEEEYLKIAHVRGLSGNIASAFVALQLKLDELDKEKRNLIEEFNQFEKLTEKFS